MQERRTHKRHIEQGRVAVTILSASDGPALAGQTFFCLTSDVSVDGLSFKVHRPIPKGTTLKLRVELADPVEVFKHRERVTAYIHDFMTEKVTDALRAGNVHGVTVIKCEGFGRTTAAEDGGRYLDEDVEMGFARKTKIEIICRDKESDGIIELIRQAAHTGRHGDGKIFVSGMLDVLDIRTGNRGEDVL